MKNKKEKYLELESYQKLLKRKTKCHKNKLIVIDRGHNIILKHELSNPYKSSSLNLKKILSDIIEKECSEFIIVIHDFENPLNCSKYKHLVSKMLCSAETLDLKIINIFIFNGMKLNEIK
ncbi:hypothetical protein [Winogradskyella sediminis]|uniref:hypothetical protein n=1 Tax=Winogradskyella sediminis TaxID=1382466 RepID=UPI003AA82F00